MYSVYGLRWELDVVRLTVSIVPHQGVVSVSERSESYTRVSIRQTSSNRKSYDAPVIVPGNECVPP